jgi:predicted nucleotidyltransferase
VARHLIFTDREAAFLRELVKQNVPFMIVGLSAATLQGAPAVTQDIDLWFRNLRHPGIKRALRKVGGSYIPPMALNPPMFEGESVKLFDIVLNMDGLASFAQEYRHAIDVRLGGASVKVLPLERIIASKKAANREKDRRVLKVLRDALIAIEETKKL